MTQQRWRILLQWVRRSVSWWRHCAIQCQPSNTTAAVVLPSSEAITANVRHVGDQKQSGPQLRNGIRRSRIVSGSQCMSPGYGESIIYGVDGNLLRSPIGGGVGWGRSLKTSFHDFQDGAQVSFEQTTFLQIKWSKKIHLTLPVSEEKRSDFVHRPA